MGTAQSSPSSPLESDSSISGARAPPSPSAASHLPALSAPSSRAPRGGAVRVFSERLPSPTALVIDPRCLMHVTNMPKFERPLRLWRSVSAIDRVLRVLLSFLLYPPLPAHTRAPLARHHTHRPHSAFSSINARLRDAGLLSECAVLQSEFATERQLLAVHDESYLVRLRATGNAPLSLDTAAALLAGPAEDVNKWSAAVPVAHALQSETSDNPTSDFTANVAALAAGGACLAVDALAVGAAVNAFSILRPPGHHCASDSPAGFCYLNNVAVAVRHAQRAHGISRVAVVDIDVHAGDGTAAIFRDDPSVLFVSVHRATNRFFAAAACPGADVGAGEGIGRTANIAYGFGREPGDVPGAGDAEYALIFERAVLPLLAEFRAELVIVSAGFDAASGDPLGGFFVTPAGFRSIATMLGALDPPRGLLFVLEGGYDLDSISADAEALVRGLLDIAGSSRRIVGGGTAVVTGAAAEVTGSEVEGERAPRPLLSFPPACRALPPPRPFAVLPPSFAVASAAITALSELADASAPFWACMRHLKADIDTMRTGGAGGGADSAPSSPSASTLALPSQPVTGSVTGGVQGTCVFRSDVDIWVRVPVPVHAQGGAPLTNDVSCAGEKGIRAGGGAPRGGRSSVPAAPAPVIAGAGWRRMDTGGVLTAERVEGGGGGGGVRVTVRDSFGRCAVDVTLSAVAAVPPPRKRATRRSILPSQLLGGLGDDGSGAGDAASPKEVSAPIIARYSTVAEGGAVAGEFAVLEGSNLDSTGGSRVLVVYEPSAGAVAGGVAAPPLSLPLRSPLPLNPASAAHAATARQDATYCEAGDIADEWTLAWAEWARAADAAASAGAAAPSTPDMASAAALDVSGVAVTLRGPKRRDGKDALTTALTLALLGAPVATASPLSSGVGATATAANSAAPPGTVISASGLTASAVFVSSPSSPGEVDSPGLTFSREGGGNRVVERSRGAADDDETDALAASVSRMRVGQVSPVPPKSPAKISESPAKISEVSTESDLAQPPTASVDASPSASTSAHATGAAAVVEPPAPSRTLVVSGSGSVSCADDESVTDAVDGADDVLTTTIVPATITPLPPNLTHASHLLLVSFAPSESGGGGADAFAASAARLWGGAASPDLFTPIHLPVSPPVWAVRDGATADGASASVCLVALESATRPFWVLTGRAADSPRQIASLCKCMTALVVLGIVSAVERAAAPAGDGAEGGGGSAALAAARAALPDGLETRVRISERAAAVAGTSASLTAGETATIWDLLHGLMLPSGNDAALALAEALGGLCEPPSPDAWTPWAPAAHYDAPSITREEPVSRFVEEMNRAARALGLTSTRFVNPHGCVRRASYSPPSLFLDHTTDAVFPAPPLSPDSRTKRIRPLRAKLPSSFLLRWATPASELSSTVESTAVRHSPS